MHQRNVEIVSEKGLSRKRRVKKRYFKTHLGSLVILNEATESSFGGA